MSKKIEITKDELVKLYVEQDKTTYDIATLYGCGRKIISNFLKKYRIEIKRHKRKYSFYYEQKLNQEQKELITGSLLGDGCVCKHHDGINECRFIESHSIAQLDYLLWKKSILENFISNNIRFIDNSKNKSYGNGITCVFETVLHKDFSYFYKMFYSEGQKHVPANIKLSPLSLSIWFFDDGSVSKNGKYSYFATFHTESFDKKDIAILRKSLKRDFNIDSFIINVKNKYRVIRMNNKNYHKLCDIIKEYNIPCMDYKIKFSNNPVETCSILSRVSELECFDANTLSSSSHKKMMV